jgi:ankyrin repeat protein
VQALLAAGAAVDAQRHDGSTPLDLAQNQGHDDVVSALVAAQSD